MPKRILSGVVLFFVFALFAGCFASGNDKELIQKALEGYLWP